MAKTCSCPGCDYPQFGGGYCRNHQWMRTDKKPKKIKQYSDKRVKVNVSYNKESREYREANPFCRINSPDCTFKTQGVNHKKGRSTIRLLMDKEFWEPACNPCNLYCETHSAWAAENGHKLSKHS